MDPREQWIRDYNLKNAWRREHPGECTHPSHKHCLCYEAGSQCCTCGECKGDR